MGVQHARPRAQGGRNQIKFAYETGTDGNVNFDALKVGAEKDICAPATVEAGYTGLFDGTLESLTKWRMAGAGLVRPPGGLLASAARAAWA